ncbi:L-lysine 6-transaminase [Hoyosella sp. G463]|uniref:L-lysine-epsilon aminotransferase n=1 Tax=Lolliginicoccus lacisalsi TaxID=2742202 RepID=A0A927JER7_9ACTN|nr:L-lysine 6-transaminase [Lolliginicoccus lacisalsi]MBD8507042.1 L-lysine 6-transaminase [Lolliginicoccus lacisalsi]
MVAPREVHRMLGRSILTDGLDLVLDLERSHGTWLVDARDGTTYLDMFGFFASSTLGMNHPGLVRDEAFRERLLSAAINKPTNSDVYTTAYADFVDTFARVLGDPRLPHLFFIDGGANAVENALKAAFDWKSRHNERHGRRPQRPLSIMHLTDAFHGRTGYTMSLTNTDPIKTARFPVFDWPRIRSPYPGTDRIGHARNTSELVRQSLGQARSAFRERPHSIAAFIAEPIQGEGGDHHLPAIFLQQMQQLCHAHDALLILDEVQTGAGATGTPWAYQQLGLEPDIVAFGKKTHVCGIMAGGRIDELTHNVFTVPSRINSTFGGNLTDMVRCQRILEIVEAEGLIAAARDKGKLLLAELEDLATRCSAITDPRGRGLICAVTLPGTPFRDATIAALREDRHVLVLGCGERSLRFRPPLTASIDELHGAVTALGAVVDDQLRSTSIG